MARTRGASQGVIHDDDGELLDREGKPINPVAHHASSPDAPQEIVAPPVPQFRIEYLLDRTSMRRDLDAWELAQMLDLFLGPWAVMVSEADFKKLPEKERFGGRVSVRMPEAEFAALHPDLKRHFLRVQVAV